MNICRFFFQNKLTFNEKFIRSKYCKYFLVLSLFLSVSPKAISIDKFTETQIDLTSISIFPTEQGVCLNGSLQSLVVDYIGGSDSINYQWYFNITGNNSGGILIPNANASSYLPPNNSVFGTRYYYCIVTDWILGTSTNSPVSLVTVNAAPSFNTQPLNSQTLCLDGTSNSLSVVTVNGYGTPTYQWYSNTINSTVGGTILTGQTAQTYVPPSNVTGTKYYFCIATFNASACGSITSNISTVNIVSDPVILTQPLSSQTICSGGSPSALNVAVSGGNGTTSYQWFNAASNTSISGQTSTSFAPGALTTAGNYSYYVVATQTGNGCNVLNSTTANITVIADPVASITPTQQGICINGVLTPLTVTYTGGSGTASYQWYYNTSGVENVGTLLTGVGTNGASYTPPSSATFNRFYYCVITLSGSGCSTNTPLSQITINAVPSFSSQPVSSQTLCLDGTPTNLSVVTSNGYGTPTYQWYSNTSNSTSGGTVLAGETNATYTPPTNAVGARYYYCKATFSASACGVITSNVATVNVVADPVISTQPASSQTICSGGSPAALTVAVTGGNGSTSYQWFNGNTNSLLSGQTSTSYSAGVLNSIGSYSFYVVATQTGNGCNALTSNSATVAVLDDPTASITPSQQGICINGVLTPLVVSYTGGIGTPSYQWYYNTTGSNTTGTIVSGATGASYTPPATAAFNRYYYCMINLSASGCVVNSPVSQVTINALPSFSSQPVSSQTLCLDGTPTNLSVATANGNGTPTYQWYSNIINSTASGTIITGATNATYTPLTNVIGTRYYYCIANYTASACGSVSSNIATVNVLADPSLSLQPIPFQTICIGGTTNTNVLASGGTGVFSYQWYNQDNGLPMAGFTSPVLTGVYSFTGDYSYFCIISQSGSGCDAIISNPTGVSVVDDPIANISPIQQGICINGVLTPLVVSYTGGIGTPSYQWYYNTTGSNTTGTIVTGATSASYTPPATTAFNRYYYCVITLSASGCAVNSPVSQVTINALPSFSSQPVSSQTLCLDGTPINLSVVTANGNGTPTYQWYSNIINSTAGGTIITGAINATYTPPTNAVGTRYYYCIATFTASACGSITSNVATVNVVADPVISTQPVSSQTICNGGSPSALTIAVTGGNGTTSYQWYNASTNSTISGQTTATYSPGVLTTNGDFTYYVVATQNGNGCNTLTSNSSIITVLADPTASITPLQQGICINGALTPLEVTYTGGSGTASYLWYYNTTGSNTSGTAVSSSVTYSPPVIASNRYYYCVITLSGSGCSVNSPVSQVTINALPSFSSQPLSSQTLCIDGSPNNLAVVAINGYGTPTYQWYSNIINSTTGGTIITGAINATYTPPTNAVGARYYYCIADFAASACGSITSNVATVNIVADPVISTQPVSSQTICNGGSPSALTVAVSGGNGTTVYQWFIAASNASISGQTSISFSPGVLTTMGNYSYYVIATQSGNGCNVLSSATANISVIADPIASIAPTQQGICINGVLTPLTATYTGGTGTPSYQWYYNTTGSNTTGTIITGATGASYTPLTPTAFNRYYYCVITLSASGCSVNSPVSQVTINSVPSFSSQPVSSQNLCLDGTPTNLSVVTVNGNGTPTYQWYSNIINSTTSGTIITGATNATYTPPTNALGARYYYCIASFNASACGSITSNVATVNVVANPVISTQPVSSQTICKGGTATMSVITIGGTGNFVYQWYSSANAVNTGGSSILGANSSTYTTPIINTSGTYYFYCTVSVVGASCASITTDISFLTVFEDPFVSTQPLQTYPGNSITACLNAPIPGIFSSASGGVDYLNTQWYVNTNNSNTGGTIIPGATSIFYTPPSNVVGTQFYYCTFSSPPSTGCFSASNVASITITSTPQTPVQSISAQTICVGGSISTLNLTYPNPPFGPVYTYQWYSNNLNSNSGGILISGATSSSYTPTNNTSVGTTYFYCVVCGTAASNTTSVTIVADPSITTQPITSQTICSGGIPNNLFVSTSGGVGSMSYQWYSNTTNSNTGGTLITGATQNTYSPGTINTPSTFYYYVAINNSGNGCNSVNSNTSTLSVVLDPNATITPSTQNLCTNGIVAPLGVSYTGGSGSVSYQWYSSSNGLNTGGTPIPGATAATYTPSSNSPNNLFFYSVINQTASGCSTNSAVSQVIISPAPTFNAQPLATQTVCVGGTPYPLNVSYGNGVGTPNYQWWSNSVNSTTNATAIPGAINSNYTPPTTGVGATYYFCIISFTAGNCGYITSNISVVSVVADPAITLQPTSTQTLCVGGTASALAVIAAGGSGTFSYQWYNASSNSAIAGANSASFSPGVFNSEINNSYYVQINQSGTGCNSLISNTAQLQVVADPILSTDLPSNQIYCQNASLPPLEIFVTGGTQLSYQWFNAPNSTSVGNSIMNANSSVFTPTINSVGINFYYCQVTSNGNGCTTLVNSTPLLIEIVAQPQILDDAFNTGACLGNSIPSYEISGNYDSQANIHFFQSNTIGNYDGSEISSTNFTPSSSALGNYSYYFTYNVDYPGCIADTSDFYNVTITDIPSLNISSNEPLTGCSGAEIELTNSVSPNLTNDFILVWNLDNSSSDTTYASNVYSTPPIETAGDHDMLVQMLSTLQYCSATDELSFSIDIVPDPSITEELNFIQSLCPFDEEIDAPTVLLDFDNQIGPPTYTWYQIAQNNTFQISNSNQNYYLPLLPLSGEFNFQCVIIFDFPGCDVSTSTVSQLTFDENSIDCFPELIIPEAISPNNDGMNDFWTISDIGQFNGYEINIFNSFGQSVYFAKNKPPNWDGTWNGQTLPNGDYFYAVKLFELNRTIFGTISISR